MVGSRRLCRRDVLITGASGPKGQRKGTLLIELAKRILLESMMKDQRYYVETKRSRQDIQQIRIPSNLMLRD